MDLQMEAKNLVTFFNFNRLFITWQILVQVDFSHLCKRLSLTLQKLPYIIPLSVIRTPPCCPCPYQAAVHDLPRSLLHLPQLRDEVPEARLGHHMVWSEDPHAVQRRSRVLGRGQQTPNHFVLPKLEKESSSFITSLQGRSLVFHHEHQDMFIRVVWQASGHPLQKNWERPRRGCMNPSEAKGKKSGFDHRLIFTPVEVKGDLKAVTFTQIKWSEEREIFTIIQVSCLHDFTHPHTRTRAHTYSLDVRQLDKKNIRLNTIFFTTFCQKQRWIRTNLKKNKRAANTAWFPTHCRPPCCNTNRPVHLSTLLRFNITHPTRNDSLDILRDVIMHKYDSTQSNVGGKLMNYILCQTPSWCLTDCHCEKGSSRAERRYVKPPLFFFYCCEAESCEHALSPPSVCCI